MTGPDVEIELFYDATGRKWRQYTERTLEDENGNPYVDRERRTYYGGIELVKSNWQQEKLESINTGDGRILTDRVEYHHADHLGNNRVRLADLNEDGAIAIRDLATTVEDDTEILQEDHYYPFGLGMHGNWYATTAPESRYRYNGKELDEATGLYAYGARYYDPAIGRFTGVDPIADKFAWVTVYNYAENKPISYIDLWGLQAVFAPGGDYMIVGYRVEKNDGLTQVTQDINDNYGCYFSDKVQATDVMYNNLVYFPEKSGDQTGPGFLNDRDNFYDIEHTRLNMNEGDYLDLTFTLESQYNFMALLEEQSGLIGEMEGILNEISGLEGEIQDTRREMEHKRRALTNDSSDPGEWSGPARTIALYPLEKRINRLEDEISTLQNTQAERAARLEMVNDRINNLRQSPRQ